jgi:WD40 repeat protein
MLTANHVRDLIDICAPLMQSVPERRGQVAIAFGRPAFINRIVWGEDTQTFITHLLGVLLTVHQLEGRHALGILLESVRDQVGDEQQARIDALLPIINTLPPEMTLPTRQRRIFLSYARADDEGFVRQLHQSLTEHGYQVWWDRVSMPSRAMTFLQEIRDAVNEADQVLLVVGPAAVQSVYVAAEWQFALSICKPVMPILRLGDYGTVPDPLKNFHTPDARATRPYDQFFEELARLLADDPPALGTLYAVPSLPPHFLPRHQDISTLEKLLLADVQSPTVVVGNARKVGLYGMGGTGKSVVAAALANSCEVRRAFPDGVFWLTIGQQPQALARQADIARAFGDPALFNDVQAGKVVLSQLLKDKRCLLILDDIWDAADFDPFDVLGNRCRVLITSRYGSMLQGLGMQPHALDMLGIDDALALLSAWTSIPADKMPANASTLAQECGRLPLALALCGAQIRDGALWDDVLAALREADLAFLDHPNGSLLKSIKVGLDALERENASHATLYRALAVFPKDVAIPEAALLRLWEHQDGLNARNGRKLLSTLGGRALLSLDGEAPNRKATLHDLQHDYLEADAKRQAALISLHQALLNAYNLTNWADIPIGEAYLWDHLAYHLEGAGRGGEFANAVESFRYLAAKCVARDPSSAEVDIAVAARLAPGSAILQAMATHFSTIAHILSRCTNATEICQAFCLRLGHVPVFSEVFQSLEAGFAQPRFALWRALPDQPPVGLLRQIKGAFHQGDLEAAFSRDGKTILARNNDAITAWDVQIGGPKPNEIREAFIEGNTTSPDGALSLGVDKPRLTITLWKTALLENGEIPLGAEPARDVSIHPNGQQIAFSSQQSLKILDMEGALLRHYPDPTWRIRYTPNGKFLLAAQGGYIAMYDGLEERVYSGIGGHTRLATDIAISRDGSHYATASQDGTIRAYRAGMNSPLHTFRIIGQPPQSVAITPDNHYVVGGNHDLFVWELKTGKQVNGLRRHTRAVTCLVFDRNGRMLFSGDANGTLTQWFYLANTGFNAVRSVRFMGGGITSLAISPNNEQLAVTTSDGTLTITSADMRAALAVFYADGPLWGVAWANNDHLLASGDAGLHWLRLI